MVIYTRISAPFVDHISIVSVVLPVTGSQPYPFWFTPIHSGSFNFFAIIHVIWNTVVCHATFHHGPYVAH